MNIEEDITCSCCHAIYKDPVILNCCGNVICKEHIDAVLASLKQTSEKAVCPLCDSEVPSQTFQIIKPLKILIEKRELHKLKIDPKFETTLKNLKDKIKLMEKFENDPDNVIYESISELKRQVDLDREQLKEEIDKQANEIIKKLESLEIEFKRESKTKVNLKEVFDDDFKKSLNNQLREYEKTLNSIAKTNEERENKRLEIEESLEILESKLNEFEKRLFSNKTIKYEPFTKNIDDMFGKLVVNDVNSEKKEYGNLIRTIEGHNDYVYSLAFIGNDELASCSNDKTIKIWSLNDGTLKKTLEGHTSQVYALILLPNGDLASGSRDNTIKIWDLNNGSLKRTLEGHSSFIFTFTSTRNGDLVSGSFDNTIKMWYSNYNLVKTFSGHTNHILALISVNNGDLISGSFDKTIKIWNSSNGTEKKTLTGHTEPVYALVLLQNGDLASGSNDNTIKIWDLNDATAKRTLSGHTNFIWSLALLKNGDLVSGSYDFTIKIWDTKEGQLKKTLTGHAGCIRGLLVLKNGDLVSGSFDKTIKIWNFNDN
jgi:WD40 repeat protein